MNTPRTAIVVGGGLAGIAAALALAKQGVKVQLHEAKRRLGGRTGSFSKTGASEQLDYCQHVGMGCCTNLQQLIGWLGQRDEWETHRRLHFYGPSGRYQRLSALPLLPAPLHLAGWLWGWPGLSAADRVAVARGMLAIRKIKIGAQSDHLPAEPWLVSQNQTPNAIDRFWRTIIVSALGEHLLHVNLSSVAKVLQDGFLNHRDAFHLLVPKRPLGELFGTWAESTLRDHGVVLYLKSRVQRLVQTAQRKFAIEAELHGRVQADAIVVAIPWFRMRALVDATGHEALMSVVQNAEQIAASPISGIHTWWDRPWLDTPHAAIVGRMCQWVFPKRLETQTPATSTEHYYQVVLSAAHQLPRSNSPELMRLVHEDLAAVFPKARDATLLRIQVVTDPLAVFSASVQCSTLRPQSEVPDANVWLAGDWVQTGWPATMESAILSGWKATETILASWGKPVQIAAAPLR